MTEEIVGTIGGPSGWTDAPKNGIRDPRFRYSTEDAGDGARSTKKEVPLFTTLGIHLVGEDVPRDGENSAGGIYLAIDGDGPDTPAVTLWMPDDDDEAVLAVEMLTAALDNVASRVQARRLQREHRARLAAGGLEGAGASVQAYRG